MKTVTQSAPQPALPPIQADLVDDLMLHANHATGVSERTAERGALPDFVNLTAKLTLGLLILCMYVPLVRDYFG